MTDYFKDNPSIPCPICGRKFRRKTIGNDGKEHINEQCYECYKEGKLFKK